MRVGRIYRAKVNNMIQTVRLDDVSLDFKGRIYYKLTNLGTGRQTTFRSAAKFVAEVLP